MSLLKHCAEGNLTEITAALKHNRSTRINVRDNHNWTCLHHAVTSGNVECIKYLLTINELDTTAETFEGETALHIACNIPNVSLEIISTLIEANPDLVNYVNNEEVDLLHCAIVCGRLDIVEVLIANGAPVNKQDLDGDTALHIAAINLKLDVIQYLLYETQCDPTIQNEKESTACFYLYAKLLEKIVNESSVLSQQEIDCFEDFAQFTYSPHNVHNNTGIGMDLNRMVFLGYLYNQSRSCLYSSIIKLFYVPPSKQHFVEKILESDVDTVPSCHCLIVAILSHNVDDFGQILELSPKFLLELYNLFLWNEPFFEEYISEISSCGWMIEVSHDRVIDFSNKFAQCRDSSLDTQKLFTFLKTLILYAIDFNTLMRCCEMVVSPDVMLSVFAPLCTFVCPTYPLREDTFACSYNFNESENVLLDMHRSMDLLAGNEVVSLKNLCRMSIRRYYFQTHSHFSAIKTLYSLNVPPKVRNFLCYNFCNFEF